MYRSISCKFAFSLGGLFCEGLPARVYTTHRPEMTPNVQVRPSPHLPPLFPPRTRLSADDEQIKLSTRVEFNSARMASLIVGLCSPLRRERFGPRFGDGPTFLSLPPTRVLRRRKDHTALPALIILCLTPSAALHAARVPARGGGQAVLHQGVVGHAHHDAAHG